jgi:hydroxymethylpyrimidine pyrophosphatase-like HAD family hydrolase
MGNELVLVGDDFTSLLRQPGCLPSKLQILCVPNIEKFSNKLGESASVVRGFSRCLGGWYIEILHPNVNKGKGLEKLCKILRLPIDTCVAIGHKKIEIKFLKAAGFGLAIKSSAKEVENSGEGVSLWTSNKYGVMKTLKALDRDGMLWSD